MARQTRDEIREDILAAASSLFTTQGYLGTSLQDIAAAVGYSKSALLYHFESKAAILGELATPGLQALQALEREVASGAEADRARTARDGFVRIVVQHRRACAVIFANHLTLREDTEPLDLTAVFESLLRLFVPDPDDPRWRIPAVAALAGLAAACSEPAAAALPDDELRAILTSVAERLIA